MTSKSEGYVRRYQAAHPAVPQQVKYSDLSSVLRFLLEQAVTNKTHTCGNRSNKDKIKNADDINSESQGCIIYFESFMALILTGLSKGSLSFIRQEN